MAPLSIKFIGHGLFVMRIGVNPHIAHHTRTTPDDIEVLKKIFPHMFNLTASAARPAGSITPIHIWWADHANSLGSFNEYKFFEQMTPRRKDGTTTPSTSLDDYIIPDDPKIKGCTVTDLMENVYAAA